MDFALQNDFPVIAEEVYFQKPSIYERENEYSFRDIVDGYNVKHGFSKPTDEKMEQLKKYPITASEKKKIFDKQQDMKEAAIHILQHRDQAFEKLIFEKIDAVEKREGKIDAIITWTWYPSLEWCCKKRNIKILFLEQTTFRPDTYRFKLGYFQFYDKYDSIQMDEDYQAFLKQFKNSKHYFNRKELLALFLSKDNLPFLNQLNRGCRYEFGCNIGPDYDPLAEANCQCNEDILLKELSNLCMPSQVSVRIHPMRTKPLDVDAYTVDHSKNSLEWILQNRRIVSIGSNLAFEAMLLGRTSYIMGKHFPYRFGGVTSLSQIEDKIADIRYLNYIIFGYYVPYDFMFDVDYITWRLEEPSLLEIYEYNLSYILSHYAKLSNAIFLLSCKERLKVILKESQKLENDEIEKYMENEREEKNTKQDEKVQKRVNLLRQIRIKGRG